MSEMIQRLLLKRAARLQFIVNEKLAKRGGRIGKFFTWMAVGPRAYGQHIIPKYFRFYNTYMLDFGFRFNWARAHLTKIFTREREMFIPGYAGFLIAWAWFARKNRIRPLYRYEDYHLYRYDNPTNFTKKYNMYIPYNVMNYKISAHYIEINRIYVQEMWNRLLNVKNDVVQDYVNSSERVKRTKYALNPNYVYEPYGWELEEKEKRRVEDAQIS